METIAIYWEEKIKTYGFDVRRDLTLGRLSIPMAQMGCWGEAIERLGVDSQGFLMTIVQRCDSNRLILCLLFSSRQGAQSVSALQTQAREDPQAAFDVDAPVELICFHGPHYGDRYGIAAAAFKALAATGIPVRAAACAGASIYLVVDALAAEPAVRQLKKHFVVPASIAKRPQRADET